ncbi:MAG: hypothetical protein DRQ13_05805 [Ignavibacteriae bacterium]|nr:MAG: hypothetical protein DRQ13_05805 [Ignavibacteriota bacterium]
MFLRLLLSLILFTGLLSAQEDSGDKRTKSEIENYSIDTTLIEIFSTISKEYDTFLDIAPIPIYDELTDLDNENVDQVLESSRRFNDLVNNDKKILGSVEQSVKSSKDYDTCETDIVSTVCTYFRDKGNYSIKVVQEISIHWITYKVYYSGDFKGVDFLPGVFESLDYDSIYLLQDQLIWKNGKYFIAAFYRPVFLPEFSNQIWHTSEIFIFDDETTIYTPWGTSSNQVILYKSTDYEWDFLEKYNHPSGSSEMRTEGNILTLRISNWSYKNEQLYHFWVGFWDFESQKGTWITFNEDGIVQNTGPM